MEQFAVYLKAMESLPVNPQVASRVLSLAETDRSMSFTHLESLIKLDPGLSSRVLKVANSALYGRSREITNLQTAIAMLGFQTLKSLVVLVTASSLYHQKKSSPTLLAALWNEAVDTAFHARILAGMTGNRDMAEEAFLGGLLQDIGKLSFALGNQASWAPIRAASAPDTLMPDNREAALEAELLGIDHRELGARVLESWDFPAQYAEVCRHHGEENSASRNKKFILLTRLASFLAKIPPAAGPEHPEAGALARTLETACAALGLPAGAADIFELRSAIRLELDRDDFYRQRSLMGT